MTELANTIYNKNLNDITREEAIYLAQFSQYIPNKLWLKLLIAKTK